MNGTEKTPAAQLAASLHLPTKAMIGGRAVPAAIGDTFATINPLKTIWIDLQ